MTDNNPTLTVRVPVRLKIDDQYIDTYLEFEIPVSDEQDARQKATEFLAKMNQQERDEGGLND